MDGEYYLKINDINIRIYDSGRLKRYDNDLALLFLHGSPGQISNWKYLIKYFERYYRTIAYDLRGYGGSDKPLKVSLEEYISDLREIIKKSSLSDDKVILIGHSFGGMIVQEYAARYRVRGIVLIGSLLEIHPDIIDMIVWRLPPFIWRKILFTENFITRKLYRNIFFAKETSRETYEEFLRDNKDYMEKLPYYVFRYLKYFNDYNGEDSVKKIESPTLIIVGDEDKVTPPRESYKLNKLIKNSKIEVVNGAGHLILYEKSDILSNLIHKFVNEIESSI